MVQFADLFKRGLAGYQKPTPTMDVRGVENIQGYRIIFQTTGRARLYDNSCRADLIQGGIGPSSL